ncbi:MAG: hypothetical protein QW808_03195 [Desulfurococcaceae archaeon]
MSDKSSKPNMIQLLEDLKKGVILSGRLSELHYNNLKMYPFIFFDGLKKCEMILNINTDPNTSAPSVISYILFFNKKKRNDNMKVRCDALKQSVKTLLWDDVQVEVYVNSINNRVDNV